MSGKLTDKQQAFVDSYLRCWNASEAARRAGYSDKSAGSIGSENLKKPEIIEEIKRRVEEHAMTADEAISRLADQARGVPEGFIEIKADQPFLNWEALASSGKLHLIKKLKYNDQGRPEVEFYDAQTALLQIIKLLRIDEGKPTERTEYRVTGLEDLSDDDLDRLIES